MSATLSVTLVGARDHQLMIVLYVQIQSIIEIFKTGNALTVAH
jgi:hypothetical protein